MCKTHHGAALHGDKGLLAILAWQQHQRVAAPRQVWRGRINNLDDLERLRRSQARSQVAVFA